MAFAVIQYTRVYSNSFNSVRHHLQHVTLLTYDYTKSSNLETDLAQHSLLCNEEEHTDRRPYI